MTPNSNQWMTKNNKIKALYLNRCDLGIKHVSMLAEFITKQASLEEISLNERIYTCDCGLPPEDRDIHAAKNMIVLSKIRLGLGRTELTPVDIELDSNGALMNEAGRFCKESSRILF